MIDTKTPQKKSKKKQTFTASDEGIEKAEIMLRKKGFGSKAEFATLTYISRSTITKFFLGQSIQLDSFKRICDQLGLNWQEICFGKEMFESKHCSVTNDELLVNSKVGATPKKSITIDCESKDGIIAVTLEGNLDQDSHNRFFKSSLEVILKEYAGKTIKIIGIYKGSIRLIIQGVPEEIEKIISGIQSGEIKELNSIPIEGIEILKGISNPKKETEINNKWQIVKRISNYEVVDKNLSGADLSDADLSNADLGGAALRGADLSNTDLSDANLRGANLSNANLSNADLSGADLSGADLSDADLSNADLGGAALRGADMSNADLSGADLSGVFLRGANLNGANLNGANLQNTELDINTVRELSIEDLLGRHEIAACPELLQHDITNRVVLVTGGGGSIGSELCRQIAKQQPELLIFYELHEFALYQMDMELSENYPNLKKVACLGSVTDDKAFTRVLTKYRVNTIYHAAAYKHVPIVEANPLTGMTNNIGGTLTAAQCAIDCKVDKFVLISTDKAVRPITIMGATKRVAELVLQGLADLPTHNTCFAIVRFGNVLANSGSVTQRFREQITSGKSITLTHADITRYFMTIPEAANLVIQAGAMAQGGEVFSLDMGEPVKIYDLAVQMIRLQGMEPHKDVKIEITGLRSGEKICEERLIDYNTALPTEHPKIFYTHEAKLAWKVLSPQLSDILNAAANCEVDKCISILHNLVPNYQPTKQFARNFDVKKSVGADPKPMPVDYNPISIEDLFALA
jgi:nucleoside-diphosphate-sugar epimerase